MSLLRVNDDGENLVFLVGCPRSGTTFLQSLLTTQKQVASFPETQFFTLITQGIAEQKTLNESDYLQIETGLKRLIPDFINADDFVVLRQQSTIKEVFIHLLDRLNKEKSDQTTLFLEKTPGHFCKVQTLKSLFPKCKIIFILRNPFDVIASRKNKLPKDKEKTIKVLAQDWKLMVNQYLASKKQFGEDVYSVFYEALSADNEKIVKEIAEFLGVTLDLSLLDKYRVESKKLIRKDESWKADVLNGEKRMHNDHLALSDDDKYLIYKVAKKEMEIVGYVLSYGFMKELLLKIRFKMKSVLK